jgi:hypothetical protein
MFGSILGPERGIAEAEGERERQPATRFKGSTVDFGVDDRGWVLGRVLRGLRMDLGMRAKAVSRLVD